MRACMYLRQKTNLGGVEYQALSCCNVEGGPALALYQLQIWWPRPPKLSAGFLHPISNTPWNVKKPQTHHHAQWTISVINRGSEITVKPLQPEHRNRIHLRNAENRIYIRMPKTGSTSWTNSTITGSSEITEECLLPENRNNDLYHKCREKQALYQNLENRIQTTEIQFMQVQYLLTFSRTMSEHQLAFVH
jgi:hypothetical protein